ncbi:hypothetical protein RJ639_001281 [Escallonia herrerae]|uniref:Zinc knuckle CX2CX4HX4C domain-containing protein n=1 Tax=Escallonia herrerae TaxID=1293975 RepID=A0AA88X9M6_9ASTE|nr:hypothetical protein RJ639_001281 [Escallonia herrerae]
MESKVSSSEHGIRPMALKSGNKTIVYCSSSTMNKTCIKFWKSDLGRSWERIWLSANGYRMLQYTKSLSTSLLSRLGNLMEIERSKEGKIGVKGYMRLRVDINIEEALPKGFIMKRTGVKDIWVHFRYERLPDLCFGCGHLGHDQKWCHQQADLLANWNIVGAPRPYGPWIRTSYEGDWLSPKRNPNPQNHFSASTSPAIGDCLAQPEQEMALGPIMPPTSSNPKTPTSDHNHDAPSFSSQQEKSAFWENLRKIVDLFSGPWMGIGDYNEITASSEKVGGRPFASPSTKGLISVQKEEPNHTNLAREANLQMSLDEELKKEESLWMEKSRFQKILEGDRNTSFFHLTTILISPLQAAFVPNRMISDNSIMVQELWHTMRHKKGKSGLMAIKLNLEKAS